MRNWLLQRLTAVVMMLYLITVAGLLFMHQPMLYQDWRTVFSPIWMRSLTLFFCLSLLLHAWLGVRDILKDYVPSLIVRAAVQKLFAIALLGYGVWSAMILWGV